MPCAAAVLAAGRGLRYGGGTPKPLLPFAGRPLVLHAVDAACASGLTPVVAVVSDARVADALSAAVAAGGWSGTEVRVVRNDRPESGISSSLRAALESLTADAAIEAVVVGLSDQPLVGAEAYRRVAAAYAKGARLAVATYGGQRANPVLIGRTHWNEASTLAGDVGARALVERYGAVEVPCDDTGAPTDVDTPSDLAALEASHRSRTETRRPEN